jgi:hypothetical protein
VTSLYSGFAFLVVLVAIKSMGRPTWVMPPKEVQDLAKLVFAMSIMWMYFFWSQYLVIWYGNVPVETRYLIARFFADPYRVLAWTAFFIGWLIPFAYLLPQPARHLPRADRARLRLGNADDRLRRGGPDRVRHRRLRRALRPVPPRLRPPLRAGHPPGNLTRRPRASVAAGRGER